MHVCLGNLSWAANNCRKDDKTLGEDEDSAIKSIGEEERNYIEADACDANEI